MMSRVSCVVCGEMQNHFLGLSTTNRGCSQCRGSGKVYEKRGFAAACCTACKFFLKHIGFILGTESVRLIPSSPGRKIRILSGTSVDRLNDIRRATATMEQNLEHVLMARYKSMCP